MNVNLVLQTRDGIVKKFALPATLTVIGRRQDCDLCIPLMGVSRRHCQINQDEGNLKIRDLGSKNGTYINDEKIEEAQLNPGDSLRIGALKFTIQIDGVPEITSSNPQAHRDAQPAADQQQNIQKNAQDFAAEDLSQLIDDDITSGETIEGINNSVQ